MRGQKSGIKIIRVIGESNMTKILMAAWYCPKCPKFGYVIYSATQKMIEDHLREHRLALNVEPCHLCGKEYKKNGLLRHIQSKHPKSFESYRQVNFVRRNFVPRMQVETVKKNMLVRIGLWKRTTRGSIDVSRVQELVNHEFQRINI